MGRSLKHHDSSACKDCHETIHKEWSGSFHARSMIQSLGSLWAFVDALEKERKAPTDKTQMLKCLDCHAPIVNDASEDAVNEIVALIKTAVDDRDEAQKRAARDKLSARGTRSPAPTIRRSSRKGSRSDWKRWDTVTSWGARTFCGRS